MDIQGLDFFKRSDDSENEEMRVTGLDFGIKKEHEPEAGSVTGLDFITGKDTERAGETDDHGVTGLDFIKHTQISSGDHNVQGLDCIKTTDESKNAEVEGLDSIHQRDFSDFGITQLD